MVEHEPDPDCVSPAEKEDAFGRFPVPPGPPGLLVVGLDRLGEIVMNHEPHIGLVDAHTECDGGAYDPGGIFKKRILYCLPDRAGEAGMVRHCCKPAFLEVGCALLGLLLAQAVHDAGLPPVSAADLGQLDGRFLFFEHPVLQVLAVETANELIRLHQAQLLADVPPYSGDRCCRERDHGSGREAFAQPGKVAVLGAKVMAPFRDAVSLVYGDEPDRKLLQEFKKTRLEAPLRGDKEEPEPAVPHRRFDPAAPGRIEQAVPRGGRNAPGIERVHLVFHEGKERGDHERKAAEVQRGQLVAERFPAAGGQDRKRVVPAGDGGNDSLLVRAECGIAPVFPEQGEGSLLWYGCGACDGCGDFFHKKCSLPGGLCTRVTAMCDEECGRTVYEPPGAEGENKKGCVPADRVAPVSRYAPSGKTEIEWGCTRDN